MRCLFLLLLLWPFTSVLAEACLVQSRDASATVQRCQQNRSIPPALFRSGFCSHQPEGSRVEVHMAEQCPSDFWGVCRNSRVGRTPYRQDIFHYGRLSQHTAQRSCEQNDGIWMSSTP